MMLCNVLKDSNVSVYYLESYNEEMPLRFSVFDLSGWNEPYPFCFVLLKLVFLPPICNAHMLTGPLNFANEC